MSTVYLRATTPADLDFVLATESAPDNRPFIGQWSHTEHLAALENEDFGHFVVVAGERPVGYLILSGCVEPNGSVCCKRLAIAEKGKGYGRKALQLARTWAFETLRAHRFWLDVKVSNARARALYASEGFILEGVLRECLREADNYQSLAVLSILRHEYEPSKAFLSDNR